MMAIQRQREKHHEPKILRKRRFAQCDRCKMFVKVRSESFIPLTSNEELTNGKWVCHNCWDNCCCYGYKNNRRIVLANKIGAMNELIAANRGLPRSVYPNVVKSKYSKEEFIELKQILREQFINIEDVKYD
jgi:hypothetical protein